MSASSSSYNRKIAKEAVLREWKDRRSQRSFRPEVHADSGDSMRHSQSRPPAMSFCRMLRRSAESLSPLLAPQHREKRLSSTVADSSVDKRRDYFPSVLHIVKAHEITKYASSPEKPVVTLPAGYDWPAALKQQAQARGRAFWLMDLGQLVERLVAWKRIFVGVNFVYPVQAHADPPLLQLLRDQGVHWSVASCADLDALPSDHDTTSSQIQMQILEGGCHAKTFGFLRRMWNWGYWVRNADGAEEMQRIRRCYQSKGLVTEDSELSFVLLLPSNTSDWVAWLRETMAQAPGCRIVGFVLPKNFLNNLEQINARLGGLLSTLSEKVDLHMSVSAPFSDNLARQWQDWRQHVRVARILVEVTRGLVPAALCTRIIGLRDISDGKRHYYIDDGKYSSLHGQTDLAPLLLEASVEGAQVYKSTVWGPTCDGLDRVCGNVLLPALHRDDWLVFDVPIASGLATAFNGFDPPDTVYCVLDYFR